MALLRGPIQGLQRPPEKDRLKGRSLSSIEGLKNYQVSGSSGKNKPQRSGLITGCQTEKETVIWKHHFDQLNHGCPRFMRSEEKSSRNQQLGYKNMISLKYSKWYIKPQHRLKIPSKATIQNQRTRSKTQGSQFYNKLYKEQSIDLKSPQTKTYRTNLDNLDNLSIDNAIILEKFKEALELNKKRVPKIVNVFIERKFKQLQSQRI